MKNTHTKKAMASGTHLPPAVGHAQRRTLALRRGPVLTHVAESVIIPGRFHGRLGRICLAGVLLSMPISGEPPLPGQGVDQTARSAADPTRERRGHFARRRLGPSGSGKSMLIGLAMAFYRPLRGEVRVDGRDLRDLKLRDYRQFLGVVMQDNFLFDGTIRFDIAFSKPDATDAEIREAARIAHCDEFIERFDEKYETIVGERGVKLSGGQRQRVGIARAILANPRVLILDEATSSLDSEAEALIQDGLRVLRRGRTTFVIAHRLSTIRSLGPDPGAGGRPDRGAGHAPGADGAGRALPAALREAVRAGAGPVHQPGRGAAGGGGRSAVGGGAGSVAGGQQEYLAGTRLPCRRGPAVPLFMAA